MTGGIIGVGLAVYVFVGTMTAVIFGLIGIVAIFVACYHLWREERSDKLSIIETKDKLESSLANDIKQLEAKIENTKIEKRPKLIGFFQDLRVSAGTTPDFFAYKEDLDNPILIEAEVKQLIGVTVSIRVGFVNESQTPTTIHNFGLTVKLPSGKTFTAKYPVSISRQIEKLKESESLLDERFNVKGINLDVYLDDSSKIVSQGKRIEGFLVFNFNDLSFSEWIDGTMITLSVEDAFGENHLIVDWGMPPKPHQRIGYLPR